MIESGRANFAYKSIQRINSGLDEYTSHVKQMPMLIKNNGLAQALAFAKANKKKKDVYQHINAWMLDEQQRQRFDIDDSTSDIIEFIIKADSSTYRLMTSEIMVYLEWLKRFSEGRKLSEERS